MSKPDVRSSAWVAPTFTNSWVNFGTPYVAVGYSLKGTRVHLRGVAKNGTADSSVFTLPTGLRPSARHIFTGIAAGAPVRIDVAADGTVFSTGASGNSSVSLSGISFDIGN